MRFKAKRVVTISEGPQPKSTSGQGSGSDWVRGAGLHGAGHPSEGGSKGRFIFLRSPVFYGGLSLFNLSTSMGWEKERAHWEVTGRWWGGQRENTGRGDVRVIPGVPEWQDHSIWQKSRLGGNASTIKFADWWMVDGVQVSCPRVCQSLATNKFNSAVTKKVRGWYEVFPWLANLKDTINQQSHFDASAYPEGV